MPRWSEDNVIVGRMPQTCSTKNREKMRSSTATTRRRQRQRRSSRAGRISLEHMQATVSFPLSASPLTLADSASLPPAGRGIKHKEPRSSAPGQPLGSAKGHATPAILTGGMLWPNPALLAASPYPEFAGPPGWQPLRHPLPQLPLLYPLPQFPHPQGQPSPYFPGQGGRGGWQQKPS
eukprot:445574-Hanusia_phi.AAC.3